MLLHNTRECSARRPMNPGLDTPNELPSDSVLVPALDPPRSGWVWVPRDCKAGATLGRPAAKMEPLLSLRSPVENPPQETSSTSVQLYRQSGAPSLNSASETSFLGFLAVCQGRHTCHMPQWFSLMLKISSARALAERSRCGYDVGLVCFFAGLTGK